MDAFLNPIAEEQIGRWRLVYSIPPSSNAGSPALAVDIALDGVVKGRRTITTGARTEEQALALLRVKALEWIKDFEGRHHTGDTGFGDL